MPDVKGFLDILAAPGNVVFEQNSRSVQTLTERASKLIPTELSFDGGSVTVWHLSTGSPIKGPRILIHSTGHVVFYGIHGQRFLGSDPAGTPIHECEWILSPSGTLKMTRARVQLDCQQWLGIQSEATEQVNCLELPSQSPGKVLSPDTLRQMGARVWQVPLEDLRYFFPDESFTWEDSWHVTVRLKKDGVYFLKNGTFQHPLFVSYMGAIPWARIDLLNVVELYQATLPGTGGAVFDLLWGLCDDQQRVQGAIPLRYRGLPTFPSDQAYGVFCAFFQPEAPHGENPYTLFMDTQRANEIAWWPRSDPPWRYFDRDRGLCVTVQRGMAQKVTLKDDPVAVPYVNPGMKGFASCDRTLEVVGHTMQLRDGPRISEILVDPVWGITQETPPRNPCVSHPFGWRSFFGEPPPQVDPVRAWTLALIFPDDGSMVREESTQLFALEQAYGFLNQLPNVSCRLANTNRILIHNFDPICAGFVDPDNQLRQYTILYTRPEWAQKNAQVIWDRAARDERLKYLRHVEFLPEEPFQSDVYRSPHDFIYRWIPYEHYDDLSACEAIVKKVAKATSAGGLVFVVGPPELVALVPKHGLKLLCHGGVDDLVRLPAVIEHFRIHPNTCVNPQLTVALGEKVNEIGDYER